MAIATGCGGNAFSSDSATGDGGGDDSTAPIEGGHDGNTSDGKTGDGAPGDSGITPADAGGVTVTGTVVDALLLPVQGAQVRIDGHMATTGPAGGFAVPNVTSMPYTATVLTGSVGTGKHLYIIESLTRLDPTLQALFEYSATARTATFQGTAYAGAQPGTAGIVFADMGAAAPATGANVAKVGPPTTAYQGTAQWSGPVAVQATLYDLQWFTNGDGGPPDNFIAYASQGVTLTNGQTTTWDTPMSVGLASGSITTNTQASAGYLLVDTWLALRPPTASIAAPFAHVGGQVALGSFVTPTVTGGTFTACAIQALPGSTTPTNPPIGVECKAGLGATDTAALAPPKATTLISPPTMVDTTTMFNWNGIPGGITLAAFEPGTGASPSDPSFYVLTAGTSTRISDPSGFGLTLRSGASYNAMVYGFAPYATVDAASSKAGYSAIVAAVDTSQSPLVSGAFASSGPSAFTVK